MLAVVLLITGVALVVSGAELLFGGLLASARRLRFSPFVLTVVLSGFELENLAAGIAADLQGLPGAAAGTFLGGTTFLALGVAGLSAMVTPISAKLRGAALAWTAVAPLPTVVLALDGRLSRLDGALLLVWFAVALAGVAHRGSMGYRVADEPAVPRRRPFTRLLAGLAMLSAGGEVLGEGMRRAVSGIGISETLLGNTAIAASVELEEVARVSVPARRGRGDLALANIVGTIVHFISFNAGVIALVRPLTLDGATRHFHLPAAAASTVLLCALVCASGGIGRRPGAMLLGLYAAYLIGSVAIAVSA